MPHNRPSLQELFDRVSNAIASRLSDSATVMDRSNANVAAAAQSGAAHGLHGHIEWVFRQMFPHTCDADMVPLHAATRGLALKPAAAAQGAVNFTGADGAVIVKDTVLQNAYGHQYVVDQDVTIVAGTASISVTAAETGAASNLAAGEALSFLSPLADVDSNVTVDQDGIDGGVNEETLEELRIRVLERWRKPPQGGAGYDYEAWAKEIPGVTRVWVTNELGEGTVTVRYVMDEEGSVVFPGANHIALMEDHLERKRPITAEVNALAPVPSAINLTIRLKPNTEAVQKAITAEINDVIFRHSEPSKTILISKIREAVSIAAGEYDHELVTPNININHGTGEMGVLGTITWEELT